MPSFTDNSEEFLEKIRQAQIAALTACGQQAVSHAKKVVTAEVPRNGGADWYRLTGDLRKGISKQVSEDEKCVYIGTNLSYAKYNEYGTGIYADNGAGKQGFWVFVPGGDSSSSVGTAKVYTEEQAKRIVAMLQAKGVDAHMTNGMRPIHFLKRSIEEHKDEYRQIIIKYTAKALPKGK